MRRTGVTSRVFPCIRILLRLSLGALLSLNALIGCATVEVVHPEHLHGQRFAPGTVPIAHMYVANWGWYLFKHIPLFTGNLNNPGVPRLPNAFTDNVRVDLLVDKVTQVGRQQGGTVISDLRTRDRSYYMAWTLFFWLNEFEVSANASRLPGPGDQDHPEVGREHGNGDRTGWAPSGPLRTILVWRLDGASGVHCRRPSPGSSRHPSSKVLILPATDVTAPSA